jgi:UrcA family protein
MDYIKLLSACVAVGITGGSFAVIATPVHAKSPVVVVANQDIVTRSISYTDLNLASSPGEVTLNRRVGGAIKSLCLEATGGGDFSFMPNLWSHKCRTSAWNQARPQIALAVQRSRDIALTGMSPIAAVAITIDLTK